MASAMFLQAHKALPWSDAKVKARAVALGAQKGTLQNACSRADKTEGGQPRISCLNWVNWTGLEMIAKKTKIEAVSNARLRTAYGTFTDFVRQRYRLR
jgi:hypothetical protein